MDATCTIQDSIHVFNLVHKYVSRILGTYQRPSAARATKRERADGGLMPRARYAKGAFYLFAFSRASLMAPIRTMEV